jgi:hypothetical protein
VRESEKGRERERKRRRGEERRREGRRKAGKRERTAGNTEEMIPEPQTFLSRRRESQSEKQIQQRT